LARNAEAGRERRRAVVDGNDRFVAAMRVRSSSRRFRRKRNDDGEGWS
jgi:hypothetical protein